MKNFGSKIWEMIWYVCYIRYNQGQGALVWDEGVAINSELQRDPKALIYSTRVARATPDHRYVPGAQFWTQPPNWTHFTNTAFLRVQLFLGKASS